MNVVKYGVVILNFKTAEDAINAAKSVIQCSENDSYKICIVDGGSNTEYDISTLSKCKLPNTDVLICNENKGYGVGNNFGIRYLLDKYSPEYIVVMNPDVLMIDKGTIEGIIDNIEKMGAIGGQPLVWTKWKKETAENQINIRNVYNYQECLIESFFLLKKIFRKKYENSIYKKEMPYHKNLEYYCPSGAFFIIKAESFQKLGLFDEKTFLYNEEIILGYKIHSINQYMILVPKYKVIHESGKSIGSNSKKVSKFAMEQNKKSMRIYLQNYLKVGRIRTFLVMLLMELNYSIKEVLYILK